MGMFGRSLKKAIDSTLSSPPGRTTSWLKGRRIRGPKSSMISKFVRSSRLTKSGGRRDPKGTIMLRWNIHVADKLGRYGFIFARSFWERAFASRASQMPLV
eukprot:scaffold770_cov255-Pinguiococcus_pyrenoidosus.AAC.17